ncbi:hypothetical protein BH23CHL5_BH23CHL5_22120 [soil metagenome]
MGLPHRYWTTQRQRCTMTKPTQFILAITESTADLFQNIIEHCQWLKRMLHPAREVVKLITSAPTKLVPRTGRLSIDRS